MSKWLNFFTNKKPEFIPVLKEVDCKESRFESSYQALDASFHEEVDIVAMTSFPQQKTEQTSLSTNRQICHLHLDDPQAILAMQEIKQENRQYQAWIRNIKIVLQSMQKPEIKTISDYENEWETSIENILKELSIENAGLLEKYKRKTKEIQYLEDLLEKLEEENIEIIDAIDAFIQPVEVFGESIKRYSFSSSTETIVPEETSIEYVCRESKESGYSSQESIYSSTETLISEESDAVFMQTNKQITELGEKNEIYKKWIRSLNKKLNFNLTLNFIKRSKTPDLKMLEDLKYPSFKNAKLKQENEEVEETIQSLEIALEKLEQENAGIHVLYHHILSEEIYLHRLDSLEKSLDNEQKEVEDIDGYFEKLQEKAAKLYENIETFAIYLGVAICVCQLLQIRFL